MTMAARRIISLLVGPPLLLLVWWSAVKAFEIPQYLVPAPSEVLNAFLGSPVDFMEHSARTLLEAMFGFVISLMAGLAGGCLLFRFEAARRIVLPWTSALQAIPIVAIAPLLVVWCGSGMTAKVLMSAIISFFPILNAVLVGFSEVDQDRRVLFQVYRTGYLRTLCHLLLPSALPTIVMGVKISAGLATVGAIVAEMTGADKGLGYVLLTATYRLETPTLFVAIILSGLIGWLAYTLPGIVKLLAPKYWESTRSEVAS
jgi:NitT/TauT family transport system permease protein